MKRLSKDSAEIGFTIVSLTVSLIAADLLLFMADIVGRLFREFAVTLAVTIILSAVVSLTLTPMMAARILRHHPKASRADSTAGRSGASSKPSSSTAKWCGWCFATNRRRC